MSSALFWGGGAKRDGVSIAQAEEVVGRPCEVGATRPQPQSAWGKVCEGPRVKPALLPCGVLPHPHPYSWGSRKDPRGPFLSSSHSSGLWVAASLRCCPEGDPGMSALRGGDSLVAVEPSSAPRPPGPPHCRASRAPEASPSQSERCIQGRTCCGNHSPHPPPSGVTQQIQHGGKGKGGAAAFPTANQLLAPHWQRVESCVGLAGGAKGEVLPSANGVRVRSPWQRGSLQGGRGGLANQDGAGVGRPGTRPAAAGGWRHCWDGLPGCRRHSPSGIWASRWACGANAVTSQPLGGQLQSDLPSARPSRWRAPRPRAAPHLASSCSDASSVFSWLLTLPLLAGLLSDMGPTWLMLQGDRVPLSPATGRVWQGEGVQCGGRAAAMEEERRGLLSPSQSPVHT